MSRQIQFLVNGSPRDPVPSTSPIPKTGLINGQENTIRVRSIDNGTTSPWSNEIKVFPEEIEGTPVGQADAKYRFDGNSIESYSGLVSTAPHVTYQTGIYGQEAVFTSHYQGKGFVNTGSEEIGNGLFCAPDREFTVSLWGTCDVEGAVLNEDGDREASGYGTYIGRTNGSTAGTFQLHHNGLNSTDPGIRGINVRLRGVVTRILHQPDGPDGVRRHLVIRWDGTTAHAFVNNVKQTVEVGIASENTGENLIIGSRTGGSGYFLKGKVDEVNIFNTALTDEEITDLYINPQNPMVPFLLRSASAVAGDASITVDWNIRAGEVGSLTSVEWSLNDGDYEALPTTLTGTESKGTYLGNPIVNGTTYAVRIKAVTPDGTFISDPISVTPSPITSEPLAPDNPAYMEWYNEVVSAGFIPPDQPGFRESFRDEILSLVGFDPTVINIINYQGYNSNNAKTAMNDAIAATPVGGTLLIPQGVTLRLNNFTISKRIRIDCRGTIKRCDLGVDGTSTSHIIRLNASCLWDGGTIDANRESWGRQPHEVDSNGHPIRFISRIEQGQWLIYVNARSVVRNVHGINMCELYDSERMQWAGFRIDESSYFESVICERNGGRQFNIRSIGGVNDMTGDITTYNGTYLYKCEARDYQRKGIGTGGTSGWVMLDDCKWHGKGVVTSNYGDSNGNLVLGSFRAPEDGVLLETGHNMELDSNNVRIYYHEGTAYYYRRVNNVNDWYDENDNPKPNAAIVNDLGGRRNHTAYFLNCVNDGWWSSKSDGYKFRIINNCTLKSYHNRQAVLNIDICGVSTCTVHANSLYYLRSVIAAFDSTFESYNKNDGVNPTGNPNFIFGELNAASNTFKRPDLYMSNCVHTYNRYANSPLGFSQRFSTIWAKDCVFNVSTTNQGSFMFFGRGNTGLKMINDGYTFYNENCTFNHANNRYVVRKGHRSSSNSSVADYEVGTFVIINPQGNVNPDFIHDVSERNKVQRAVHSGNRVFVGQAAPTDGVGWRVGDRIVNSLSNMNVGWVCTVPGTGGVDAVFVQI